MCLRCVFGVNIISKATWGDRSASSRSTLARGLSYAVHTADTYCSTQTACPQQKRNMQNYHMDALGGVNIGYNFLIGGDGSKPTFCPGTVGARAANWNFKSNGIFFNGNYNDNVPTTAQIAAADAVSRGQILSNYILYGHRQVGSTKYPGDNLYDEIKKWSNWRA